MRGVKFEDTSLPDLPVLREAFNMAARNYGIYSDLFMFDKAVRRTEHLHLADKTLPPEILGASILANAITVYDRADDIWDGRALLVSDVVELLGPDADLVRVFGNAWYSDVLACPPPQKTPEELKAATPLLRKFLLADISASNDMRLEGKYSLFTVEQRNYGLEITAFSALRGQEPSLDVACGASIERAEAFFSGSLPKAEVKKSFDHALKAFQAETAKAGCDMFAASSHANEVLVRRDRVAAASGALDAQAQTDIARAAAQARSYLAAHAAALKEEGVLIHCAPQNDPVWGLTYKTFAPR